MTLTARQRFLPRQITRLINGSGPSALPAGGDELHDFDRVADLVAALYHFEFHGREQAIAELWDRALHDGDADAAADLRRSLAGLLEDSNYHRMSMDEVEQAVDTETLIPLRLDVVLDDYRELLIYRRGSRHEQVDVRGWGGLRHTQRNVTIDTRLVMHAQVQPAEWFAQRDIDPAERGLEPGRIILKHFRDVPRANIKSLLPSVQVRFRPIDSLMLGIPAVASGLIVLLTKLLTTLGLVFVFIGAWIGLRSEEPTLDQGALVALFGGLVALGSFLVRQWTKLKNRRVRYLKVLTEHLYHHTIGDGPDVVHALMYSAERQEVAELLLAYRFLLATPAGRTVGELDDDIEGWLHSASCCDIDFDIDDAVTKLDALGLITTGRSMTPDDATAQRTGRLVARPATAVRSELNVRWDALFSDDAESHVPVTKQR